MAIVKAKGYTTRDSDEVRSNQLADTAAKEAAKKQCTKKIENAKVTMMTHIANLPDTDIKRLQS